MSVEVDLRRTDRMATRLGGTKGRPATSILNETEINSACGLLLDYRLNEGKDCCSYGYAAAETTGAEVSPCSHTVYLTVRVK